MIRTKVVCGSFILLLASVALRPARAASSILTHGFAVATNGGTVYAAGQTSDALAGQQNYGATDAFVEAYDQSGNLLWTRQFGSTAGDRAAGVAADGTGVYAVGLTYGAMTGHGNAGEDDSFIAKFDSAGNTLWINQFGTAGSDPATAAAVDNQGNVYMVGVTGGSLAGPSFGSNDAYIRKYGQNGQVFWTVQFGTSGDDRAYGVAVDSTGVYVTGRTSGVFPGQTALGGLDAFVTKFDTNGNQIWLKQFGSPDDDRGWGIATDSTGIYVAGRDDGPFPGQTFLGNSDAYVAKFDTNGNSLWVNEFGTPHTDRANGVVSAQGTVYVGGFTNGAFDGYVNAGGQDCFLGALTLGGVSQWTTQFGTSGNDTIRGLAADSTGIYVAGEAAGTLVGQTVPSGAFLVKYDFSGNTLWIREFSAN